MEKESNFQVHYSLLLSIVHLLLFLQVGLLNSKAGVALTLHKELEHLGAEAQH